MPADDRTEHEKADARLDEALTETFPASDPISIMPDPAPVDEEPAS
ncbi:hypothetical protein [Constrictibacter sp. MBR-5]